MGLIVVGLKVLVVQILKAPVRRGKLARIHVVLTVLVLLRHEILRVLEELLLLSCFLVLLWFVLKLFSLSVFPLVVLWLLFVLLF